MDNRIARKQAQEKKEKVRLTIEKVKNSKSYDDYSHEDWGEMAHVLADQLDMLTKRIIKLPGRPPVDRATVTEAELDEYDAHFSGPYPGMNVKLDQKLYIVEHVDERGIVTLWPREKMI